MRSFLRLVAGFALLCVSAVFAELSFARGGGDLPQTIGNPFRGVFRRGTDGFIGVRA